MEQHSSRQPLALQLPDTRKKGHGCGISLLLLLVLLAGGGSYFWIQSPHPREDLQRHLENARELWHMASASFAALLNLDAPPPPPVGEHATSLPPAASSEEIGGLITPPDTTTSPVEAQAWQEDQHIRLRFVEDLAHWLTAQYRPGKNQGQVADIRALNERYGTKLVGLHGTGADAMAVRTFLLRYAFTPSMLEALYALYSDRFLAALSLEAATITTPTGKPLNSAQKKQLYTTCATRCTTLAALLDGLTALPDLGTRLQRLDTLEAESATLHLQSSEAAMRMADAQKAGQWQRMRQLRRDTTALHARYRNILEQQRVERQHLGSAAHASGVDEDTLLFAARWVQRRLIAQPQTAHAALNKASAILRDMAQRLAALDPDAPPVPAASPAPVPPETPSAPPRNT